MLREAREALGLDRAQVAESTRIRPPFIEAIEEGRFNDLPGSAYAPAFLRSYAACVGLDVERVMQVYRSADAPAVVPVPAHQFPLVAPERRVPRGAMLLASAVLLVCAYVTWHALTRDQMTQDARVPPVPQRLLADQKPATPASEPAPPAQAQAPAASAAVPPTAPIPAVSPAPASSPSAAPAVAATPPVAPAAGAPAVTPPPPPAAGATPVPVPVPQPSTAGATPPSDPAGSGGPRPTARADSKPMPPADASRGTGGDVKPGPAAPQVAASPPARRPEPARKPDTIGTTGDGVSATDTDPTQGNRVTSRAGSSRSDTPAPQQATLPPEPARPAVKARTISAPAMPTPRTVRAEVDSTLELRGPTGEVLATTYLHAGATYTVPEYVGYVLTPAGR